MTKIFPPTALHDETSTKDFRKDMMRVMSEVSFNPANVISDRQEELASFMVNELRSYTDE